MVRVLEDVTYAARQLLPSGAAAQVPSQDARRAAPRRNDPGEDLRQGGLPTAVGPEQRHEVAALQGEMRAAQRPGSVGVLEAQVLRFRHWFSARRGWRAGRFVLLRGSDAPTGRRYPVQAGSVDGDRP